METILAIILIIIFALITFIGLCVGNDFKEEKKIKNDDKL